MASDDRHNHDRDKLVLVECLDLTEKQLRFIVFERKELFRKEFLRYFPGPWDEVEHRFKAARTQIKADDVDWVYLEGVGLTKTTAAWKRDLMREAAKHGVIGRFLDLANSFLGSLSGGLPVVEFIKEYKDCVEGCLKIIPRIR